MDRPTTTAELPVLLALRALGIGDLLVTVPALAALRRSFPGHRLVLATPDWLAPLVGLIPGVDLLAPTAGVERAPAGWPAPVDVAVNLHGSGPQSSAILDAVAPVRKIGHRAPGWTGPEWVEDMHERTRWIRLLEAHGVPGDPADVGLLLPAAPSAWPGSVVVHVGAAYSSRRWPGARFALVAGAFADAGLPVVITGGRSDRPRAAAVSAAAGLGEEQNLAGMLELDGLAALIASARLVICVDTGAAHLASAYRVPSVVLFGPAPPERWGPPHDGPHRVLTDLARRRGDLFADRPDPALLAVSAADVLAAAWELGVPSRPVKPGLPR